MQSFSDYLNPRARKQPSHQEVSVPKTTTLFSDYLNPKRVAAGSGVNKSGNPAAMEPTKFFNEVYQIAKKAGARFPELVASQAALESGWGKSPSGRNNFFGQKATSSQSGRDVRTRESIDGRTVRTVARFRDYNSIEESILDHIKKWEPKYATAKDARAAAQMLQSGDKKYATDPEYVGKLTSILSRQGY